MGRMEPVGRMARVNCVSWFLSGACLWRGRLGGRGSVLKNGSSPQALSSCKNVSLFQSLDISGTLTQGCASLSLGYLIPGFQPAGTEWLR